MLERCGCVLLLISVACLPASRPIYARHPSATLHPGGAGRVLGGGESPSPSARKSNGRPACLHPLASPVKEAAPIKQDSAASQCRGGASDTGQGSDNEQSSVLRTLLEVRRRFELRRQQAGLSHQCEQAAASTASAGAPEPVPNHTESGNAQERRADGRELQGESSPLRKLNEAKRRRTEAAAAAAANVALALTPGGQLAPAGETEGEQEKDCIVCGESLIDRVLGRVDCKHAFCFECIHKWSSSENSCPTCRQPFLKIDKLVRAPKDLWSGRRLSTGGTRQEQEEHSIVDFAGERWKYLSSIAVEERKQRVEDMVPDEEGCAECGGGSRTGILIMCDGCDVTVCLDCAGLTTESMPRENEPWFCQECDESEEATGNRRRRARRRAQAGDDASSEDEAVQPRGSSRGSNARQRTRSMGGEEARRAARALGRNYRSSGRGRMHAVLDGFVVDDGDAFLSEDEDWIPDSSGASAEVTGGRPRRRGGARSQAMASRYPTRTRTSTEGGGSVRKRSEGNCVAASTRLATRNRAVGAVRAGGRVAALAATKRRRRRMASLSDTSAEEEEEEEEEGSVWEPHSHLMKDDDFLADEASDEASDEEEEDEEQEGTENDQSLLQEAKMLARSSSSRRAQSASAAESAATSVGSSTEDELAEDLEPSVSVNL